MPEHKKNDFMEKMADMMKEGGFSEKMGKMMKDSGCKGKMAEMMKNCGCGCEFVSSEGERSEAPSTEETSSKA